MSALHFKLNSGRVLLLEEPLTPEEVTASRTPEGMKILEHLADLITARAKQEFKEGSPEYEKFKQLYNL